MLHAMSRDIRHVRSRFVFEQSEDLQTLRSEEHTSELQSQFHLVCRLLLEKKKYILDSSPLFSLSIFYRCVTSTRIVPALPNISRDPAFLFQLRLIVALYANPGFTAPWDTP